METKNQKEEPKADNGYPLLCAVKRFLKKYFTVTIKEKIIIYKRKYPAPIKSKQEKMRVGQKSCHIDCGETGLTCAWVSIFPKEVEYQLYCPYQDSIGLCTTDEECDFKREITFHDKHAWPDLFDDEEE